MKKMIIVLVCLIFMGCGAAHVSTLNNLQPGISKAELKEKFNGKSPDKTLYQDGYYVLKYGLNQYGNDYPHYFVFDKNDQLIAWGEYKGQKKIIVAGVTLQMPIR